MFVLDRAAAAVEIRDVASILPPIPACAAQKRALGELADDLDSDHPPTRQETAARLEAVAGRRLFARHDPELAARLRRVAQQIIGPPA